MIRLAALINTFSADFITQYRSQLRPEHLQAMAAIKRCRTASSLKMQVQCTNVRTSNLCRIPAAIATARTVRTTKASNGWNVS
jgi:hypothetical protein